MQPLVSVILPYHNRSTALQRAVRSVMAQTYQKIELIVVDDGSDQDLFPLLQEIMVKSHFQCQFIRQQNAGPGAARRAGLQSAQGEYVVYLDSDDELLPQMVQKLLDELVAHPESVMCCARHKFTASDGSERIIDPASWKGMNLLELALNCRPWHTSACMWHYPKKDIAVWPNLYGGEDIVHDVSVGVHNGNLLFFPEVLLNVYDGDERLTGKAVLRKNCERLSRDVLAVRMTCFRLLSEASLIKNRKYSLPFVERCFRGGIQLAMLGDVSTSMQCLQLAVRSSVLLRQRLGPLGALILITATFGKMPNLYRLYFKLHLKLTSPKIHCYKMPSV